MKVSSTRPVARCRSGRHVLHAGYGAFGVGEMWSAADGDVDVALPVRSCCRGLTPHDPCQPETLDDLGWEHIRILRHLKRAVETGVATPLQYREFAMKHLLNADLVVDHGDVVAITDLGMSALLDIDRADAIRERDAMVAKEPVQ